MIAKRTDVVQMMFLSPHNADNCTIFDHTNLKRNFNYLAKKHCNIIEKSENDLTS